MIRVRTSLAFLSALAATALSLAAPASAAAAPLGSVRLSQNSGTVDADPIFATATASKPCPAGYGRNAQVRIGPPGGPYSNVAKPLTAGGYDKKAVSVKPNRSFARALAGAPTSGEWWVVVECYSETVGMHPERFITPITVTGRTWKVGQPVTGKADLNAPPLPQPVIPTVAPTASAAAPPASAPVTPPPTVEGTPGPDARLASNNRTGSGSPIASAGWAIGVVAVLAVVGGIAFLSRRRRAP